MTQTIIDIRPYRNDDRDATIAIFLSAIREVASRDYTPEQIAVWARADDPEAWQRARTSRPTWIAELDGQPVGFTDLLPDGLVDMMFVAPEAAGRGVATRLLQTVERSARMAGIDRLWTEASLTAEGFFAHHGFTIVRRQVVERRGQSLRNAIMEKHLLPDETRR